MSTSFERTCICNEAANFNTAQKFLLFDILHRNGCEGAIKETRNRNDSRIDLTKLPKEVITQLYKALVTEENGAG